MQDDTFFFPLAAINNDIVANDTKPGMSAMGRHTGRGVDGVDRILQLVAKAVSEAAFYDGGKLGEL